MSEKLVPVMVNGEMMLAPSAGSKEADENKGKVKPVEVISVEVKPLFNEGQAQTNEKGTSFPINRNPHAE